MSTDFEKAMDGLSADWHLLTIPQKALVAALAAGETDSGKEQLPESVRKNVEVLRATVVKPAP